MAKVTIDVARISKAAQAAMGQTALVIHRQAIMVIAEPGAFPGFPGDIIDTTTLQKNQQPPEVTGRQAILRNTVDYAFWVHEGYTRIDETVVEGRPWMTEAVKRANPQATFETILKAKLGI